MRIRSIKPEFWSSPDIAALSDSDRLLFIGLWSFVDDHGRGRDDIALIVAALYPHDMVAKPRETVAKVRDGLARLSEADLIFRYTVASRTYFLVTGWGKHQRVDKPKASRIPEPTEGENDTFPQNDAIRESVANLRDDVATPRDTLAPGTGEQGNRGTGEQGNRDTIDDVDLRAVEDPRPDVDAVCDAMAASVQRRTGRTPRVTAAWRTQARLMIDRDGRTVDELTRIIDWVEADDFWRANILSVPKLRQKFDTLRLQSQRPRAGQSQSGQVFYDLAEQFAKEKF